MALWLAFGHTIASSGSLLYKNYLIRYDRGWDILCEPYKVQPKDWILKIFHQKGEISYNNFTEFVSIFKRLNPHVKNMDMIRPGQIIDIPLRKLEPGTFPGQATGMVTIPFVSLTKMTQAARKHSAVYEVKKGDTISQLICRHFGRFGSTSYKKGIKKFKTANPNIENLDLIYAGQKLYMPDPAVRDQFRSMASRQQQDNKQQANKIAGSSSLTEQPAANRLSMGPDPEQTVASTLAIAAQAIGAKLLEKGTYFVPHQGKDFEVDMSVHPVMKLEQPIANIVFSRKGRVMGIDSESLGAFWPGAKVVPYDEQATVQQVVTAIFSTLEEADSETASHQEQQQGTQISFMDHGVLVVVRSKWTRTHKDQRTICITPIQSAEEQTPESMRRYLEQNDVVIKEILPDTFQESTSALNSGIQRHAIVNMLDLAPAGPKDFVRNLARSLGLTFSPDVVVSFPYAGIQIKAVAHWLSSASGKEILIDFGDLYGDAVKAIESTGPTVVQIFATDDNFMITRKIFDALELNYEKDPIFLAARRTPEYNVSLTIPGLLYTKQEKEKVLLSPAALHPAVSELLGKADVRMIVW
ncbi:MAG: LysM peptidoglycan-binding domain-containing protein [Desulfobacteraceae bacterium]|nr:LysM peptidoglycan-binding domain-containing protein [Desulfobacteraceae bacterium]